jgi:hypothetical protein
MFEIRCLPRARCFTIAGGLLMSAPVKVAPLGVVKGFGRVPTAERVRVLPVHAELAGLFPDGGLRRGSTALLLALLAEATEAGSWAAVVGYPDLGILAAAEAGVALERLALVPRPGSRPGTVIAALLDGVDLVVVASTTRLTDALARRLSARARHRGAVLLVTGPWPGADVELTCEGGTWAGLELGFGHLLERQILVESHGRGAAARPARMRLLLPGPDGTLEPCPSPVEPFSEPRDRRARIS